MSSVIRPSDLFRKISPITFWPVSYFQITKGLNLVEVLLTCSIVAYVHLAKKNILDLNALKFEILLRPVSN